jgi:DnaJ family protein C protein 8
LKKDEEETKEMWKRKREHEEQWEGTREQRVCFHLSSNVS